MASSRHSEPTSIKFQLLGVSELIEMQELRVPMYQRSYCWKPDEEVRAYWEDLARAFRSGDEYFLGTVVLTAEGNGTRKTIIDGQQRLVTTSLLLAAIRDELKARKSHKHEIMERDFLARETMQSDGKVPRLVLNSDDNAIFRAVASGEESALAPAGNTATSQAIRRSFLYLKERASALAAGAGADAVEKLLEWVEFLKINARIGVIEVPTEADAYVIFETLNNRGADLTTADLLKNYVYGRSGNSNLITVQEHWMRSLGALELTAADAKFTAFLRHFWSSRQGLTRERDLYASIKKYVNTETRAVDFAVDLSEAATHYAAIGNPTHDYWSSQGANGRADLQVLARLNLAPNRPLLLAAMDKFDSAQLRVLLRSLVSWSVRGMVAETINSGSVEEKYCDAAVGIRSGRIKNVDEVRAELSSVIPSDSQFEAAFAISRVSRAALARYYLVALERSYNADSEPELVPNEDGDKVNLEHVLPQNSDSTEWPQFSLPDERREWSTRLGNMVLLAKGKNGRIGNKSFAVKSPILKSSDLALTRQVGERDSWTQADIADRQAELAKLAVSTWPR